jgi:hypothetical protein
LLHPHHRRCARTLYDKQQENAGDENILKQITEYFYEDNWLDSFPTTTEAISTNYWWPETLKKVGIPLSQWATSNETVP